jgi:hypothetical protein
MGNFGEFFPECGPLLPDFWDGPQKLSPWHFVAQVSAKGSERNVRFEPILTPAPELSFASATTHARRRRPGAAV